MYQYGVYLKAAISSENHHLFKYTDLIVIQRMKNDIYIHSYTVPIQNAKRKIYARCKNDNNSKDDSAESVN